MAAQGFPLKFGAGVVASSGALGILIPPSIVMVLYSLAQWHARDGPTARRLAASVGALFMAGVIPGILLAILLGLTTFYRAWKFGYPRSAGPPGASAGRAFRDSFWGLALIVIIMGGIYGGLFTPTEAAAMSAVYAFFVAVFVYKDLKLADVPRVLLASAAMSAMLLYIITNAILFSFLLTHEQIPQAIADWIVAAGLRLDLFLVVVNVLLLARRLRHGAGLDHAHPGADPVPGRREARHRPRAFRDHHGRQHGDRHADAAGGLEPLRGERHHQTGPDRGVQGRAGRGWRRCWLSW